MYIEDDLQRKLEEINTDDLMIRCVTFFLNTASCIRGDVDSTALALRDLIEERLKDVENIRREVAEELGTPIWTIRLAVSPISRLLDALSSSRSGGELEEYGLALAEAICSGRKNVKINLAGGYSANVERDFTRGSLSLISSLPKVLSKTDALYSNIGVASSISGWNLRAIKLLGEVIPKVAWEQPEKNGFDLSKLLVSTNISGMTPYFPAATHVDGLPDFGVAVGLLNVEVLRKALKSKNGGLDEVYKRCMLASFKTTVIGEKVGLRIASKSGASFIGVDATISPWMEKSIALLIEDMGVDRFGGHGTTFALALLNQALKRGALSATDKVLGYTGAMTPMAEDSGIMKAVRDGEVSLEKLEALTAVCSMGMDMIVVPGDTPSQVISGIIADQTAIGVVNNKPVGVRIIVAPGAKPGDTVDLRTFGKVPVIECSKSGIRRLMGMEEGLRESKGER